MPATPTSAIRSNVTSISRFRRSGSCRRTGTRPPLPQLVSPRGTLNRFDDSGRIADGDTVRRNVLRDNRSCADHRILPDGYPRENDRAAAKPDVVTDRYRFRRLQLVSAGLRFEGMDCRE